MTDGPADDVVLDEPGDRDPSAAPVAGPPSEAPAPPADPPRSPWASVVLSPLRGGTLGGLVLLTPLMYWFSWLEGGIGGNSDVLFLRALLALAAIAVLALYARRVVLAAVEDDRPVPWFRDERDSLGYGQTLSAFALALLAALAPAIVVTSALDAAGAPGWVSATGAAAALCVAVVHLPFALASSVLRQGAFGASWARTFRAWRANREAAKVAVVPTAVFFGLVVVSVLLAHWLVPHWSEGRPESDHKGFRDAGRWIVFAVRFASMWAALCSFRVAGLLARDVPEIREVLS